MNKLIWNEGMSVGVEAIDNDHKKLLSIISQLTDSIEEGTYNSLIEPIFYELENYIKIHFSREEALMRSCEYEKYDEHIEQHRTFAERLPALKQQLLAEDSIDVALEINLFLYQWLIHHILVEDMSYTISVYEHGMADLGTRKKDLIDRFFESITNRVCLGGRIFFTVLFPITTVISFMWNSIAVVTINQILLILLTTLLFSWVLYHSIVFPMRRLTRAMISLAKGQRNIRFTQTFANDDLGKMINAYEQCRRAFLQADIYSAAHLRRKDINLLHRTHEKAIYKELSSIDPLTGALNRRKFEELAKMEIDRSRRYGTRVSVMMLDIDHFKKVNDTYGHASGDIVLQQFCQACNRAIRETDIFARIGGEEFVILMPETSLNQAALLAERVRLSCSKLSISVEKSIVQITVSIGVTEWEKIKFEGIADMLKSADSALYDAKHTGRNCVVVQQ